MGAFCGSGAAPGQYESHALLQPDRFARRREHGGEVIRMIFDNVFVELASEPSDPMRFE